MTAQLKELFDDLSKVIDLPRDCVELTINLHVGQAPTVTTTQFVDQAGKVMEVTRPYRIEEMVDGNETPSATIDEPSTVTATNNR